MNWIGKVLARHVESFNKKIDEQAATMINCRNVSRVITSSVQRLWRSLVKRSGNKCGAWLGVFVHIPHHCPAIPIRKKQMKKDKTGRVSVLIAAHIA